VLWLCQSRPFHQDGQAFAPQDLFSYSRFQYTATACRIQEKSSIIFDPGNGLTEKPRCEIFTPQRDCTKPVTVFRLARILISGLTRQPFSFLGDSLRCHETPRSIICTPSFYHVRGNLKQGFVHGPIALFALIG
jgi:hypothetical protein